MISLNSISILSLGLGLNLKSYMNLLLIWGPIYPQNIILPLKKGHRGLSFEGMRPSFRRDSSCCSRTERHNCLLIFTGYSPRDGEDEYIPTLLNMKMRKTVVPLGAIPEQPHRWRNERKVRIRERKERQPYHWKVLTEPHHWMRGRFQLSRTIEVPPNTHFSLRSVHG